jgi:hypothetical protein
MNLIGLLFLKLFPTKKKGFENEKRKLFLVVLDVKMCLERKYLKKLFSENKTENCLGNDNRNKCLKQ